MLLSPESIMFQFKKEQIIGPPRILEGYRKVLKFIIKLFTKYLKSTDLVDILLSEDEEVVELSS